MTCTALIGLHAFTGCDSTSGFHGYGKSKPLNLLLKEKHFCGAFINLGKEFTTDTDTAKLLEVFVCRMYGVETESANEARYRLFCMKSACEQALPPTSDALSLHIERANYQAAIHRRSLDQYISPPDPVGHGWMLEEGELKINWMRDPPAPPEILKQVNCSCKKSKCNTRVCSCKSNDVSCTELCGCIDCANQASTDIEQSILDDAESDLSDSEDV